MKNTALLVFLLFPILSTAQNLVQNGGFEKDSCQIWQSQKLGGWFQLNTADYHHLSCNTGFEYKVPYQGRGCVGLYNGGFSVSPANDTFPSHEYIVGQLVEPLEKDARYHLSFWVKPSSVFDKPWENMTTDNISLAFISDSSELNQNRIPPWDVVIKLEPDITNENGLLTDYENYTQIQGCYTADGTEKMVVIGNFSPFRETWMEPLDPDRNLYDYSHIMVDEVELIKMPDLNLPTDSTLCEGQALSFLPDTTFASYQIDGMPVFDSVHLTPPGLFQVEAQLGACLTSHSLRLEVEACADCPFYIPNAFSPDGNGHNDFTLITSPCRFELIEAAIFDRWGNQVYYSEEEFLWDGLSHGKAMAGGVYVYFIRVNIQNALQDKTRILKGDITLLR